jgi:hypothetical protein
MQSRLDEQEARINRLAVKVADLRRAGPLSMTDEAIITVWEASIAEAGEEIAFQRTWGVQGRPSTKGDAE